MNKIGEETFRQLLEVKRADIKAQVEEYKDDRLKVLDSVENCLNQVLEQRQCFCIKDLMIDGNDLMNIGIPEGQKIGITLHKLMNMVIDDEIDNDKEKLLSYVKNNYIK